MYRAGCSRVTHPFATKVLLLPFDLHVLGMPPAFVLSQNQTLKFIFLLFNKSLTFCVILLLLKAFFLFFHKNFALSYLFFCQGTVVATHLSQLVYNTTSLKICQQKIAIFLKNFLNIKKDVKIAVFKGFLTYFVCRFLLFLQLFYIL